MLTKKQHELICFIADRLNDTGVSPSFEEMKDALDLKSKSGVHRLISALVERGFIRRLPNRARALEVLKQDDQIDQEFEGLLRKLITYMMEDPRTISPSLDLLFIAKAIERIGDHAKNIAEFIIYVVKGEDVRHSTMEKIESVVR